MIVAVAEAAALLRRGGIVVYPTETFYGLGALVTRDDALRRLSAAKLRPEGKPLPLIAADVDQVLEIASLDDPMARRLAGQFWPGPLTLVVPAIRPLDAAVVADDGTVAIRVPGAPLARELARAAGGALVSTSANLSGERPVSDVASLSPALLARVDAVVDGGRTPGGRPSTIVAVVAGRVRLVREGAVPWRDIPDSAPDFGAE